MKNFETYLTGRMHKIISPVFFILMLLLFAFGFQQCSDICTDSRSIIYYEPVYTSVADLRAAIKNTPTVREIVNPGKLYYLNGYIFINQPNEGLHVINNMNPQSPVYTSFIEIPGNF
ncbi:MAG: hypothetical protein OEW75_07655, partial [Cyclobacteriaceae bacterium]|nr:hypothetical protein [Cyclobacteriaceae bacterium]